MAFLPSDIILSKTEKVRVKVIITVICSSIKYKDASNTKELQIIQRNSLDMTKLLVNLVLVFLSEQFKSNNFYDIIALYSAQINILHGSDITFHLVVLLITYLFALR